MANLNLSQFGENTSVSDADYTFVWDSANSISKKVSRNSWLNSGTLTSDAPVTISQTWGTTGTYTAFKVVANETAVANTASNLLELWAGSTPTLNFRVSKSGVAQFGSGSARAVLFDANGGIGINRADTSLTQPVVYLGFNTAGRITVVSGGTIGFSASATDVSGGNATPVTALNSDAANTLALRNGAAAQTFRVYNTYSNAGVDVEYLQLSTSASGFRIGTNSSGSGSSRPLFLGVGGGSQWQINTAGHIGTFGSDNLYDIGASGANRPRNVYVGSNIYAAGNVGIGTTSPTSKLQVSAGDVEVDTIAKGVILKSPDGTRYRVTVANGGTLSVAAV